MKPELCMLLLSLILLTACLQTTVHQETINVKGNNGTFTFQLENDTSTYEINLDLYYVIDKGTGNRKKVTAELVAPSNETITKSNYLVAEDAKKSTISAWKNIRFINVKPEIGQYNLSFKKEAGRTRIEKARVTVRKFNN